MKKYHTKIVYMGWYKNMLHLVFLEMRIIFYLTCSYIFWRSKIQKSCANREKKIPCTKGENLVNMVILGKALYCGSRSSLSKNIDIFVELQ